MTRFKNSSQKLKRVSIEIEFFDYNSLRKTLDLLKKIAPAGIENQEAQFGSTKYKFNQQYRTIKAPEKEVITDKEVIYTYRSSI